MRLYLGYHGFCRGDTSSCRLEHLWFVAYLWVYTMIGGLIAAAGRAFQRRPDAVGRLLSGWRIVVLPAAALAVRASCWLTASNRRTPDR
jgi:hypothetical protein